MLEQKQDGLQILLQMEVSENLSLEVFWPECKIYKVVATADINFWVQCRK